MSEALGSSGCTCLAVRAGAVLSESVVILSSPGCLRCLTFFMSVVAFGSGIMYCSVTGVISMLRVPL